MVVAAHKYVIEIHNSSGDLINTLERAYKASLTEAVNDTPILKFYIPADDSKTSDIIKANEIWLRNYQTGAIVYKFRLSDVDDFRSRGEVAMIVTAEGLLSQLADELAVDYLAEDKTINTITTEMLALQVLTPAITKGTVDPTVSRSIQIGTSDSLLKAFYRLRATVGGYIYLDNNRALQWRDSIGEDKGQQIRYNKNLRGIKRKIDYTTLTNRLYAYGAGQGEARIKLSDVDGQSEDYIEDTASQTQWGGIYPAPAIIDQSITHPDTLMAWAEIQLGIRKNPEITYKVDAVDLSESIAADFSFEELQLGSIVTVIDENLGIDVSAQVVKIVHSDILLHPEDIKLEIANRTKNLAGHLGAVYDQQQFGQHIATKIGAGQVVVLGTFTVMDWVTDSATTIDGDHIETGSIVLNRLDFIPLTSTGTTDEIIATINATDEGGLKILASKLTITTGISIFRQDDIPTSTAIGDLWFDTNDSDKLYVADSIGADEITAGEWVAVEDAQVAVNTSNITINETQIGLNVTSITTLDGEVDDNAAAIVINSNNINLRVEKNDVIAQINLSSESALISANRVDIVAGVHTFRQINMPSAIAAGDLWFDSNNKDKPYRATGPGYTFVAVRDGEIVDNAAAISVNVGNINLRVLSTDYTGAEIVSRINIASSGVDIEGDHIQLTGDTTVYGSFEVQGIITAGQMLKSYNYSAGSAGWKIDGDGDAEFRNVIIKGTIYTSSIVAGNTLTVSGTISAGGGNCLITTTGITMKAETTLKLNSGGTAVGTLGAQSASQLRMTTASGLHIMILAGGGTGNLYLQGQNVYAVGAFDATTITTGDLNPDSDGDHACGSSGKRWEYVYSVAGNFSGTVTCGGLSLSGSITCTGLYPDTTNRYIGGNADRWKTAYFYDWDIRSGSTGNKVIAHAGAIQKVYPYPTDTGYVGASDAHWVAVYSRYYYAKSLQFYSFQDHEDVEMIKGIKTKDGKLDISTFPAELVESDEDIENARVMVEEDCAEMRRRGREQGKSEEELDWEILDRLVDANKSLSIKGVDICNWQSLLMGAIKEIDARLAVLEAV